MTSTFPAMPRSHSLRSAWLMEKQQRIEIGNRIRELRENSAETNRSIAEHCGVGERSVAAWLAGGGIAWENAKKVAELFGVDVGYIWRGRDETPDVMGAFGSETEVLEEVREMRQALEDRLVELELTLAATQAELARLAAGAQPRAKSKTPRRVTKPQRSKA